jgi:hypothetical protein
MNKDRSFTTASVDDQMPNRPVEHDAISCDYSYDSHDHSTANHNHDNSVHVTHTHSIANRIAEAEQECIRRNVRWTPLRSDVTA